MEPKPAFGPDNSPQTRALRRFVTAQVIDITSVDRRLTTPSEPDSFATDHAMAWLNAQNPDNVVELPDPPDLAA